MNRFFSLTFVFVIVFLTVSGSAKADTGPTLSVNQALHSAYLVLDDGKIVTMDGTTRTFTLRTPQGQTGTVSFEQVAQWETAVPAEQQALVNEWVSMLNDPSNNFTFTNSHQPTLALSESSLPPPPGSVIIQGLLGSGHDLQLGVQGGLDSSTLSMPRYNCDLAPCSCQVGDCFPGHGQPWGLWGMIYYSLDGAGGGSGRASKAKQNCLADHEAAWMSQQGASCALMSSLGMAAGIAGARAFTTCLAAGATSGAALAPCAFNMAAFAAAATGYTNARLMCRSTYPGAGNNCAGL